VFDDRLLGEAAAVAFYALLAAFPALAALVSLCGLFVGPEDAAGSFQALAGALPAGTEEVVRDVLGRTAAPWAAGGSASPPPSPPARSGAPRRPRCSCSGR
jgi:membrane protein